MKFPEAPFLRKTNAAALYPPCLQQQALGHIWLTGQNATEFDLLPELLKARVVRRRFKRAVLAASLKKRIADLKEEDSDEDSDMREAEQAVSDSSADSRPGGRSKSISLKDKVKDGAVFREVVLAKLKDERQKREALEVDKELEQEARRRSVNS